MKTYRSYRSSSSFKVATAFATLLTVAVISFCFSIYFFYQQSTNDSTAKFAIIFSLLGIISLVLIAVSGYLISVFVVSRINRIANTAHEIVSTGDLSKRISIDSRWDDLSFLSSTLNIMLDKIQTLMEGVQHITDTIAHDLRTPLARIRNKLDYFQTNITQSSHANEAATLVEEVDHLLKTFNSLLSLSSLESGRQGSKFEEFDIEKVIHDSVDLYIPVAESKDQNIVLETNSCNYVGDKDLIFQVIANLLDNAIKFTPISGNINVNLNKIEGKIQLIVSDSGPGIPAEARQKVFDRFYRHPDQARSDGSGLGLSLVLAVLKLHDASIELLDNNPGLKVIINF